MNSLLAASSRITLIEAFVNPDNSPEKQGASLDAFSSFVLGGQLTIQALVSDLEVYLTTTDNAIRARGILLLAEILSCIKTKPLEDASVRSLTSFFMSRLADWQALRGAVIGCLALLKRKCNVGLVSTADAQKLAQSYLGNVHVQALRQEDRMICLELLECLLDSYADAVSPLGDDLVYGVLAAIDAEKDPRCLLVTFHIVELLAQLFPDEGAPLASHAEELFDIISSYFPISFNPPPNGSLGITRDDLSRALMRAFMSSPFFAPLCIPLLLEKLSSSLRMAKVDSLRYLGKCGSAYGVDAISSHATEIWASLKNEIFSTPSSELDAVGSTGFEENEVVEAALACVTECILAFHKGNDTGVLLELLLKDEQIEEIFKSVVSSVSAKGNSFRNELLFHVYLLGKLLSAAAKSSPTSCSVVSQRFLQQLVDTMRVGLDGGPDLLLTSTGSNTVKCFTTFGVLHLCHQILEANRIWAENLALQQHAPLDPNLQNAWLSLLQHLSDPLKTVFASAMVGHCEKDCHDSTLASENKIIHLAVAGLQELAAFPGKFSPLSEEQYRNILSFLVSIMLKRHEEMFLWDRVLEALVVIGMSLEKFNDATRNLCYLEVVIMELFSQLSIDNLSLPVSLNLKAVTAISNSSTAAIKQVFQGFRQVISTSFLPAAVKHEEGGERVLEVVTNVLDCLSREVLYRCIKMGVSEEHVMWLALDILNSVQEILAFNVHPPLQLLESTMAVMRVSVQFCAVDLQKRILLIALDIVFPRLENVSAVSSVPSPTNWDVMHANCNQVDKPVQQEFQIALFASIVVALHPKIILHNQRKVMEMFMSTVLEKRNNTIKNAAAQALGSMINKCPIEANEFPSDVLSLDGAIHSVLDEGLLRIVERPASHNQSNIYQNKIHSLTLGDIDIDDATDVQIQAVTAVAWIGKGLAMRGHNKISDVAILLLNILRSSSNTFVASAQNNSHKSEVDKTMGKKSKVVEAAADGFGIIMKDFTTSLNKDCHALIRPLYKQRFFTSMIPVLVLAIKEEAASPSRTFLYRVLGHLISEAPHVALLAESDKVLPFILDGILVLSNDPENKDHLQALLLSLSGIIVDENKGRSLVVEHVSDIISRLIDLVECPYSMMVRETALQSLGAMLALPHARIFPMRIQVLKAVSKALDDRKRTVRKEAVRCHQVWASIASR